MESCEKTLQLSQAAKEAALQHNDDSIRDLDELIRLLDSARRDSAWSTVSPDCWPRCSNDKSANQPFIPLHFYTALLRIH